MADEQLDSAPLDETTTVTEESASDPAGVPSDDDTVPPQYGIGPFSIREVITPRRLGSRVRHVVLLTEPSPSLRLGVDVGSRLDPHHRRALRRRLPARAAPPLAEGIRRVGSLGIDQFASVAFSVSAVVWLTYIWETVAFVDRRRPVVRSWVMWLEFALMLAGVVLTVFAPFIPVLCDDFRHRPEVVAHRNARPLRPVVARARARAAPRGRVRVRDAPPRRTTPRRTTRRPRTRATATRATATRPMPHPRPPAKPREPGRRPTAVFATAAADPEPVAEPAPARQQAFWALAPDERDVVDEAGTPFFRIGPTAWALVIEDRGDTFVVRHEDGRIGYLHDVRRRAGLVRAEGPPAADIVNGCSARSISAAARSLAPNCSRCSARDGGP